VTLTYTYTDSSHPTVGVGDTVTNAQMQNLYYYKYGTYASPGQGNRITPWIFGSGGRALYASDYNNA